MVVEGLGLLQIIGLSFKKDNTNINYGGMGKINQKKKKKWDDDSVKFRLRKKHERPSWLPLQELWNPDLNSYKKKQESAGDFVFA